VEDLEDWSDGGIWKRTVTVTIHVIAKDAADADDGALVVATDIEKLYSEEALIEEIRIALDRDKAH
jgi:hypothetical protein